MNEDKFYDNIVPDLFLKLERILESEYQAKKEETNTIIQNTKDFVYSDSTMKKVKAMSKRIEKATRIEIKVEKRKVTDLNFVLVHNVKENRFDIQLKGYEHFEEKEKEEESFTIKSNWTIDGRGLNGDSTEDLMFK